MIIIVAGSFSDDIDKLSVNCPSWCDAFDDNSGCWDEE